jgi:hypothetical protein
MISNIIATAASKEQTIVTGAPRSGGPINPSITDDMRSGPDQRPRGRFNTNRPARQQPRIPQNNQTFDSNGPSVKIRGSARQIFERYIAMAREAATSDDRVAAENFYQHAEHYFRIDNARREGSQQGMPPRPTMPADAEMNSYERGSSEEGIDGSQSWRDDDRAGL